MEGGGNDAIMAKALKDLQAQWEQTRTVWNDDARNDFERDYLAGLFPSMKTATTAIQRIEEVLRRARKECS
ncbi:MAG: hypothetical protein AAB074_00995 [Planctomycetota bacterium]